MSRGIFIAFEGGEASGKSTQAARLASSIDALLTREPGGTPIGEKIRKIVLADTNEGVDPTTEVLLMSAARAEHVAKVIEPAISTGQNVVTDRFTGSTLAYQGYGRGIDMNLLGSINGISTQGVVPDLTFLIDVPRDVALSRRGGRMEDRMESAGDSFHERVLDGYRQIATAQNWCIIDGNGTIDEVSEAVLKAFTEWQSERSS